MQLRRGLRPYSSRGWFLWLAVSSLPKYPCLSKTLTQACGVSDQGLLLVNLYVLLWLMGEKGEGIPTEGWGCQGSQGEEPRGSQSLQRFRPQNLARGFRKDTLEHCGCLNYVRLYTGKDLDKKCKYDSVCFMSVMYQKVISLGFCVTNKQT